MEILLSLIGALAVNLSTYVAKVQNGETWNWWKFTRTVVIGALLGLIGASGDGSSGVPPAIYTMASAGVTAVLDQLLKTFYKYINKK